VRSLPSSGGRKSQFTLARCGCCAAATDGSGWRRGHGERAGGRKKRRSERYKENGNVARGERGKWWRIRWTERKRERERERGSCTKGRGTKFRRERKRWKRRGRGERDVGALTILINPVPGTEPIAIKSGARSTRNLHKILHSRLQLNPLFIFRARGALTGEDPRGGASLARRTHDAHIILACTHGSYVSLISPRIGDSSLAAVLAGSSPGSRQTHIVVRMPCNLPATTVRKMVVFPFSLSRSLSRSLSVFFQMFFIGHERTYILLCLVMSKYLKDR